MKPENVNPSNFKVEQVVYNKDGFSIAIGVWVDDGSRRFAMRWDGETDSAIGYPNSRSNPMWFQLSEDIYGIINAMFQKCDIELQ